LYREIFKKYYWYKKYMLYNTNGQWRIY
jgi:hypothetical protein